MDSYILDTNIISALLKVDHPRHIDVESAISSIAPDSSKYVSVVTLAEIEFGLELARFNSLDTPQLRDIVERARAMPLHAVTRHTAKCYGEIKAAVATKFLPKRAKLVSKGLQRWPTQWVDEFSGELLQLDENDIWIAAQALERNFVLFTTDKGMRRIGEAVTNLRMRHI